MWTLLLWLNQKVVEGSKWLKIQYELQKAKRELRRQMRMARHLPDYLRRDMGLPPYTESKNNRSND